MMLWSRLLITLFLLCPVFSKALTLDIRLEVSKPALNILTENFASQDDVNFCIEALKFHLFPGLTTLEKTDRGDKCGCTHYTVYHGTVELNNEFFFRRVCYAKRRYAESDYEMLVPLKILMENSQEDNETEIPTEFATINLKCDPDEGVFTTSDSPERKLRIFDPKKFITIKANDPEICIRGEKEKDFNSIFGADGRKKGSFFETFVDVQNGTVYVTIIIDVSQIWT